MVYELLVGNQPKSKEAKPRRRRDPIYRVPRGAGEPRCPTTPPVGRDKSGPYALLAALVTLRLMHITADKSALVDVSVSALFC